LYNREGYAGPGLPTPEAQLPGHWAYDYALIPFTEGDYLSAVHHAYAFNAPLKAISTSLHKAKNPSKFRFLNIEPLACIISAIKPAEEDDGWIVRGYNTDNKSIRVVIQSWRPVKSVYRANLAEQIFEEIETRPDGTISLTVEGHKIFTLLLRCHK